MRTSAGVTATSRAIPIRRRILPTASERLSRLVELSCSVGAAGRTPMLDEWVLWLDMWARAPRDPDVARDRLQMDRKWRATIAEIVRSGQEAGEFDRSGIHVARA